MRRKDALENALEIRYIVAATKRSIETLRLGLCVEAARPSDAAWGRFASIAATRISYHGELKSEAT